MSAIKSKRGRGDGSGVGGGRERREAGKGTRAGRPTVQTDVGHNLEMDGSKHEESQSPSELAVEVQTQASSGVTKSEAGWRKGEGGRTKQSILMIKRRSAAVFLGSPQKNTRAS